MSPYHSSSPALGADPRPLRLPLCHPDPRGELLDMFDIAHAEELLDHRVWCQHDLTLL